MKIGIVTWYWGNYGSILQAYALQQFLLSEGHNCEVIKHHVNGGYITQAKFRITHDGVVSVFDSILFKVKGKIWSTVEKNNREKRNKCFENQKLIVGWLWYPLCKLY